ncbi:SpoIIIAH-like family protein [Bacillus aquiflavi]|uniref:SpoIIIAH-like family protein n=1 Tax=Bacillus aquiflavi TaxID=2672567 RepID=A0A6B3VPB3_9BACI|nr:SpoIIIAH-like family protein [Bacillus aquiflavi]MBA4535774.1 SpoIIIAH-like family protein [Bacillus aquiflavi]NEY80150.1 SpoIIIAH-like family protein [Bacillus aquiflavi]
MLLKKQTVWLLTMLSLVVVLSVYYITSPEPTGDQLATVEDEKDQKAGKKNEVVQEKEGQDQDAEIISSLADDEVFTALRLQLQDKRSKQKEELTIAVGSPDLTADERNEALEEIKKIKEIADKEVYLETMIKTLGYDDALVRADGEEVIVTVKAKELSPSEANEIIQLVSKELGETQPVAVEFHPEK